MYLYQKLAQRVAQWSTENLFQGNQQIKFGYSACSTKSNNCSKAQVAKPIT